MPSAFRSLARAPGFTLIAVLTLAVGLAANVAIFSAVYALLVAPLPFPASARLVSVRAMVKRDTWERRAFSPADFRDYRAQATRNFAAFSVFASGGYNLTGDGEAVRVRSEIVSHDFFATLGAQPALGRTFRAEEDAAANDSRLVVLGDELWRNRFAASPAIVGRTIKLSDASYTVIGVMRPGFRGLTEAQLWVPVSSQDSGSFNSRGARWMEGIARLRPGATIESARSELAVVGRNLAAAYPATNTNYGADVAPLREEFFGGLRRPLLVLLAAVGLVLLVTCANVANLLLVRLVSRRREVAIRVSLGASRGALARLFLGEALALSVAGGALGLVGATWLMAALKHFAPIDLPSFVSLELQPAAFGFDFVVAALCALAIGLLPALLATRTDLNAALKDAGRTGHSGAAGLRLRSTLVTAEIALSLALLIASSLFVRSFVNLVGQSPGYRTERVFTQRLLLPGERYQEAEVRSFQRTLLERAAALPGVQSAAVASNSPLDGWESASFTTIEGGSPVPAENEGRAFTHVVSAGFLETLGIALLQGENLAPTYAEGSEVVAIVSERFARRHWPKGDAIGKRFKFGKSDAGNPWLRIIGVCRETKYRGLVANPTRDPDIYLSASQRRMNSFVLLVQTAGASQTLATSLHQLVTALDPNVPVFGVATIEDRIARASAGQRFTAQLMGGFAVAALLLAAIGLYGVVSFSVTQRTPEIGVRMALGAKPADIARMVLGGTTRLVVAGLAGGVALALLLTRFIASLLFNTDARDPALYALVAAVLAAVALFAAWWPARRAARVDPMSALRAE